MVDVYSRPKIVAFEILHHSLVLPPAFLNLISVDARNEKKEKKEKKKRSRMVIETVGWL